MPRQARIDAPGALHHILCRGINRQKIFLTDTDRDDFVERLGKVLGGTATRCYAWALIPNHLHLLLQTGATPIATIMRRLLTGYAVSFNRRHSRHGHLFQNRYKSILCQEETYLLELVRYIHLNPLRARIVPSLEDLGRYRYCGHAPLVGLRQAPWQEVDGVLGRFSARAGVARKQYLAFLADGLAQGKRPDLIGGGLVRSAGGWQQVKLLRDSSLALKSDERILGDSSFVDSVLAGAEEHLERVGRYRQEGLDLDVLAHLVAQLVGVDAAEVWAAGKQPRRVQARSLLCFWAVRELGMTASDVARLLRLSQPAISHAVQRGARLAGERNWGLEKLINL